MKTNRTFQLPLPSLVALLVTCAAPARAVDSTSQPTPFSASNAGDLYQGSGSRQLVGSDYFAATVEPFDPSLGTLVSFTIACELQGQLQGTVAEAEPSGSTSGGLGGTFFLGGISFDGTGGANGDGGLAGEALQVDFGIPAYERTMLVSDAGATYNPALVDVITGADPFELLYQSAVNVDYSNMSDLAASIGGELTLTYTYETADGGIETLRVVSVLRQADPGSVTLEWVSQPGKAYTVEASPDLGEGSWELIGNDVAAGTGETTTFIETVAPGVARRFYRVREND